MNINVLRQGNTCDTIMSDRAGSSGLLA